MKVPKDIDDTVDELVPGHLRIPRRLRWVLLIDSLLHLAGEQVDVGQCLAFEHQPGDGQIVRIGIVLGHAPDGGAKYEQRRDRRFWMIIGRPFGLIQCLPHRSSDRHLGRLALVHPHMLTWRCQNEPQGPACLVRKGAMPDMEATCDVFLALLSLDAGNSAFIISLEQPRKIAGTTPKAVLEGAAARIPWQEGLFEL